MNSINQGALSFVVLNYCSFVYLELLFRLWRFFDGTEGSSKASDSHFFKSRIISGTPPKIAMLAPVRISHRKTMWAALMPFR